MTTALERAKSWLSRDARSAIDTPDYADAYMVISDLVAEFEKQRAGYQEQEKQLAGGLQYPSGAGYRGRS